MQISKKYSLKHVFVLLQGQQIPLKRDRNAKQETVCVVFWSDRVGDQSTLEGGVRRTDWNAASDAAWMRNMSRRRLEKGANTDNARGMHNMQALLNLTCQ